MNRDKNRYAIRLSFLLILTFMAMIFSASFLKAEASCPLSGESRESSEARSSREQSEKPAQSLECFSTGELICPPERTFSFALAFKSAEEALRAFRTKEEEPGPASEIPRLNASRSSISQAFRAGETPVYKMIVKYYSNDTVHPAGRQLNHATDTDSSFWAYIESDNAEVPTDGWKWSSSNPSILRIAETNEDSSICDFETPGAVGKVTITGHTADGQIQAITSERLLTGTISNYEITWENGDMTAYTVYVNRPGEEEEIQNVTIGYDDYPNISTGMPLASDVFDPEMIASTASVHNWDIGEERFYANGRVVKAIKKSTALTGVIYYTYSDGTTGKE